jgi:hypothetical protein
LRQLLDEAVRKARQHFRALYLAVALPLALLWGVIPLFQQRWLKTWVPGAGGSATSPSQIFGGLAAMFLVSIIFIALQSLGEAALFVGALDAMAGREIVMARAWKRVLRPDVLGTLLVRGALTLLGFGCCVLPGLYLYLLWCFAIPVMVDEGRFAFAALKRSSDLTSYNPNRGFRTNPKVKAFVVVFVGGLIGYAVNMVTTLPLIVVQQVMMFRAMAGGQRPDPAALTEGLLWLQVPTQILAILGQTAVQVYVVFGLALLFFDVRHRKEGQDLEAAIGALSARDAPA